MIISENYVFIFVPRTASTSIEAAILKNDPKAISIHPEVPPFQNHTYLEAVENGKTVFSVLRDPVDWILSIYNSHSDWGNCRLNSYQPKLNSTSDLTKDDMLELWYFLSKWYIQPGCYQQTDWIGDSNIILFEDIHRFFNFDLPVLNNSNRKISNLDNSALEIAKQIWKNDFELYQNLKGIK